MDIRHKKRIEIVQELYSSIFDITQIKSDNVKNIIQNREYLDNLIQMEAPKYEIKKIAKVDVSILRLAIYELIVEKKEPPKVIINEAIELAKELGGTRSPAFVNAVLGKVYAKTL